MKTLNKNGQTATIDRGELRTEAFVTPRGRVRLQWNYRDGNGTLHTGIALDQEDARQQAERDSSEYIGGRTPGAAD